MTNTFTAIYEKRGDVYIGYVEELPGANTQGDTLEEVKANLKEAVELILLSNRQLAELQLSGSTVEREELMVSV
ncbi:MAG TPA: type II toxin-antitoxin system HicB family antitoxin [Candidatus Kapabacteria bacterium]